MGESITHSAIFIRSLSAGTAWTAALFGLLGRYPVPADERRWLSRFGAVSAGIGVVVFAAMAATMLVYYAGVPAGAYDDVGQLFIPGVLVGSVLGFVSFALAGHRTDVHSRAVGVLPLLPPLLVLTNILRFGAGMESATVTLAVVVADAVAVVAIGYALRTRPTPTDRADSTPDSTAR